MLRLVVITVPVISGCASQPIVLAPVGPAPASAEAHAPMGRLQIFTTTETHPDGDNTYYYPHKGYCILSEAGKMLHFVPNHVGTMDETPSIVNVPAGQYRILADAEGYGRVTIPVVIQGGRTTVIHLERDWKPAQNASGEVVRLPGGEPVGWSATTHS